MHRSHYLKRTSFEQGKPMKRSRLKKVGKKGRESARALRVFKKECVRLGIEQ